MHLVIRVFGRFCPALLFGFLAASNIAHADEDVLGYAYGSETLPKGHSEVVQWITARTDKGAGRYRATDFYTEFEHGVTDRLQTSLYLTAERFAIHGVSGLDDRQTARFSGIRFSVEYALRNPDRDGYGLSLYLEPEYAALDDVSGARRDEFGLEGKVIFQKEWLDGALLYLANLVVEPEQAREAGETARELGAEFSHGLSRRITPQWYVGIENRWRSEFEPWQLAHATAYAGYLGPALHFESGRWWITLAWSRQVTDWPATSHGLSLGEYEKNDFRLKTGVEF